LTTTPGKDQACKSKEIASTPARRFKGTGSVTPGNQRISEREQQYSKKKERETKTNNGSILGGVERVKPPSKGGTPIQLILQQQFTTTEESTTGTNDTVRKQHNLEQSNKEGEGEGTEVGPGEVDLEGFTPGVQPKGKGSRKKDKKEGEERKTEEKVKKTQSRKPKIAFRPTEVEKEKTIAYKKCVVGFAIRIDKGNQVKQAFNKKLMEGLQFIQQYIDNCACFLPHEKDKKLKLILQQE
jgi:hypothetical protein